MANLRVQERTILANLRKRSSGGGGVQSVTGDGTTASVDNTDPINPIVSAQLALDAANAYTDAQVAGLAFVETVQDDGTTTSVDSTDPANPIVSAQPALDAAEAYTDAAIAALPLDVHGPGCVFTNGNLPLTGSLTGEVSVPYAGAIVGWTIVGDVTGSASVVVSRSTYASYDTMTTLFTASVSGAKKAQASTFTHAVSPGDILRFSGTGFSGFTRCSITLAVQ